MSGGAWSDCRIEVVTLEDGEPTVFACDDGEVRLDAEALVVSYFDDEGPVVLVGPADEVGHYALVARSRPRRATLHRSGNSFEGRWDEDDRRGYWCVELPG